MVANEELKDAIKRSGVLNYEIAEQLQISTSLFYAWLQRPLSDERKQRVLQAIEELKEEQKQQRGDLIW